MPGELPISALRSVDRVILFFAVKKGAERDGASSTGEHTLGLLYKDKNDDSLWDGPISALSDYRHHQKRPRCSLLAELPVAVDSGMPRTH